jgi:hypothetical protein
VPIVLEERAHLSVMLFLTISSVFIISVLAAVSATRAVLKFMFSAMAPADKEELNSQP